MANCSLSIVPVHINPVFSELLQPRCVGLLMLLQRSWRKGPQQQPRCRAVALVAAWCSTLRCG